MKILKFRWVFLLTLVVLSVSGLNAATYIYYGNDFTTAIAPYTTSDFLTISVTLAAPLPFTSPIEDYFPTAFSVSDGVETITDSTPGVSSEFSFGTSGGAINEWEIAIFAGETAESCFDGPGCSPQTFDLIQTHAGAQTDNLDDPGTWVPEPSSGVMTLSGALLLAGTMLCQRQRRRLNSPVISNI